MNSRSTRHLYAVAGESTSSLLPMLIGGLVLIVIGMVAVAALA